MELRFEIWPLERLHTGDRLDGLQHGDVFRRLPAHLGPQFFFDRYRDADPWPRSKRFQVVIP